MQVSMPEHYKRHAKPRTSTIFGISCTRGAAAKQTGHARAWTEVLVARWPSRRRKPPLAPAATSSHTFSPACAKGPRSSQFES